MHNGTGRARLRAAARPEPLNDKKDYEEFSQSTPESDSVQFEGDIRQQVHLVHPGGAGVLHHLHDQRHLLRRGGAGVDGLQHHVLSRHPADLLSYRLLHAERRGHAYSRDTVLYPELPLQGLAVPSADGVRHFLHFPGALLVPGHLSALSRGGVHQGCADDVPAAFPG